jgi:hypothetical protein
MVKEKLGGGRGDMEREDEAWTTTRTRSRIGGDLGTCQH